MTIPILSPKNARAKSSWYWVPSTRGTCWCRWIYRRGIMLNLKKSAVNRESNVIKHFLRDQNSCKKGSMELAYLPTFTMKNQPFLFIISIHESNGLLKTLWIISAAVLSVYVGNWNHQRLEVSYKLHPATNRKFDELFLPQKFQENWEIQKILQTPSLKKTGLGDGRLVPKGFGDGRLLTLQKKN